MWWQLRVASKVREYIHLRKKEEKNYTFLGIVFQIFMFDIYCALKQNVCPKFKHEWYMGGKLSSPN